MTQFDVIMTSFVEFFGKIQLPSVFSLEAKNTQIVRCLKKLRSLLCHDVIYYLLKKDLDICHPESAILN